MRKFLSLVMALVMMMSLVTINAGAKEFADSDDIQYVEAVEVIGEVGVVDGYASGDFGPTNGLTRQAAAKIICNLILGPTTAAELHADSAPYPDVPLNHDFAGYIAYCKQQGIISGYADGTFKGGNPLTGYAFMKMLLGALGYDAEIEGYTGENWSINVAKQALGIGLNNGLVEDFNGVDYVTREEAALYAFNTLKATMVDYEEKITVQAGNGSAVTIGNSKAYEVVNYLDTDDNIKSDGLMQFAEKYFTKLSVRGESDAFSRPANTWRFKGSKVGTYAENPDATYSKNTKLGDIYADLGMSEKDGIVEVFIDGIRVADVAVAKNNTNNIAQLGDHNDGLVGNGSTIEVFYFDDTNDVRICVINNWVGTIERTVEATAAKDRYVEIDYGTVRPASINAPGAGNEEFETEVEFEDDLVVSYTYSEKDDCIMSITELESVTGVLDTIVAGKSLKIGDTVYSNSFKRDFDPAIGVGGDSVLKTASEYTLYLDEYGYGIYVVEEEFISSDYALIVAIETSAGNFTTNRVKLLCADGTEMVANTAKNYLGTDYNYVAGDIVTWKKNDAGNLVLRRVNTGNCYEDLYTAREEGLDPTANPDFVTWNSGAHEGGTTTFSLTTNNSRVTVDGTTANDFYANSETVFVVRNTSGKYDVYTGIKNVPTITPAAAGDKVGVAYYCRTSDLATVVFIDAREASIVASNADVIFLAGKSASNRTTDIDGNVYYTYNAVVKGELKTVRVQSNANTQAVGVNIFTAAGAATKANVVFGGAHYDGNDIINVTPVGGTSSKADDNGGQTAVGTVKHNHEYTIGEGTVGGTLVWHTIASDAKIWLVDNDGKITAGSYTDIKTDAANELIWVKNNGQLTDIFVQLPPNTNAVAPDSAPNVLSGMTWTAAPASLANLSVTLAGFNAGENYEFKVTTVIGGVNIGATTHVVTAPATGVCVLPVVAGAGVSYVVQCGGYFVSGTAT